MTTLALTACGKQSKLTIPQEVWPYVLKFQQQSSTQGPAVAVTDLVVQFGNLPDQRENGVCEVAGDQTPKITIANSAWKSMDDGEREELVFHELGHCVLRRKHRDDWSRGYPASVMYTYALPSYIYGGNYENYQRELFGSRNEF